MKNNSHGCMYITQYCTSLHYSNMQILGTITYKLKARDITSKRQFHPQLRGCVNIERLLKADPLQLLGEENLYCSQSCLLRN